MLEGENPCDDNVAEYSKRHVETAGSPQKVNMTGKGTASVGRLVYRYVDQDVVDGAVNGIANETDQAGGLLTYVQSGRVQQYALILFASVGLLALLLVIFS